MPHKLVNCGVKVGMVAGSDTAYIHAFDVYTGKTIDWTQSSG